MSCEYINQCGGCDYRNFNYDEQLKLKQDKVYNMFKEFLVDDTIFDNIIKSPLIYGYRNKMEFSFGDSEKNGPLTLGMHKKKSFYTILNANECDLIDDDIKEIVSVTLKYFSDKNLTYFHKKTHIGYLRHLVVRKSFYKNCVLVNIVTTSQLDKEYEKKVLFDFVDVLKSKNVEGIIHTINDSLSDAVKCDEIRVLYGNDYIYEELLNLKFKISPFSFFQTNTKCAELLYKKVNEYLDFCDKKDIVYDLYCGTGTISQIVSKKASKVYGCEIVKDAVLNANENVKINNIDNVEFYNYDVKDLLSEILNGNTSIRKPDVIILDPPRDGLSRNAIDDVIKFNVDNIIYISCKIDSLYRDYNIFKTHGYSIKKICPVDMFPWTKNVETVCLFCKN